jgi:hypothetical protein
MGTKEAGGGVRLTAIGSLKTILSGRGTGTRTLIDSIGGEITRHGFGSTAAMASLGAASEKLLWNR